MTVRPIRAILVDDFRSSLRSQYTDEMMLVVVLCERFIRVRSECWLFCETGGQLVDMVSVSANAQLANLQCWC